MYVLSVLFTDKPLEYTEDKEAKQVDWMERHMGQLARLVYRNDKHLVKNSITFSITY